MNALDLAALRPPPLPGAASRPEAPAPSGTAGRRSTELPHHERRRHPRFELFAQIWVRHATVVYVMEIANASRSGLLVQVPRAESPPWVRLGQEGELQLFPANSEATLDLRGRIVRVEAGDEATPTRYGVELDPLAPKDAERFELILILAESGQDVLVAPSPHPAGG
jgi:hypothetical protein